MVSCQHMPFLGCGNKASPSCHKFERWTNKKVSPLRDWLSNRIYPSVYLEQNNGATSDEWHQSYFIVILDKHNEVLSITFQHSDSTLVI